MRFIERESYKKVERMMTYRSGLVVGISMGILLFIVLLQNGFFTALLFSFILFLIVFSIVFIILECTHKKLEERREKSSLKCLYLDVYFRGEMGALSILDDRLSYHSFRKKDGKNDFDIMLGPDLYIEVGKVSYSSLQSLLYKGIKQGFIIARQVPHGTTYRFIFYNIDDVLVKVMNRIEDVSKFKGEYLHENTRGKD